MKTEKEWLKKLGHNTLARKLIIKDFDLEIHVVSLQGQSDVVIEMNKISANAFGLDKDGDRFDRVYKYLCVLDRKNGEIVALYRYVLCSKAIVPPNFRLIVDLATYKFYDFSKSFFESILPFTIELGRSVVNKDSVFEKTTGRGLQSVWYGLGMLIKEYHFKLQPNGKDPKINYLFGKFSISAENYCFDSRNLIISLFKKYFGACNNDSEWLIPRKEFEISNYYDLSIEFTDLSYKEAKKRVNAILQARGEPQPKLAYSYADLGGFKVWDSIWNQHLNCWEVGMILYIPEIKKGYIDRFVGDYETINPNLFKDV